jgi:hypothetical protein
MVKNASKQENYVGKPSNTALDTNAINTTESYVCDNSTPIAPADAFNQET